MGDWWLLFILFVVVFGLWCTTSWVRFVVVCVWRLRCSWCCSGCMLCWRASLLLLFSYRGGRLSLEFYVGALTVNDIVSVLDAPYVESPAN